MCAMSLTPADATDEGEATAGQYLVFTLGEECYGIPIQQVHEIRAWSATTRLPNTPAHVRGVMNLRGQVIPVYDLNTPFHGQPTLIGDKHVVVILCIENRIFGLVVDAVTDLIELGAGEIMPSPTLENHGSASFIDGIANRDGQMIVLLDVSPLLDESFAVNPNDIAS